MTSTHFTNSSIITCAPAGSGEAPILEHATLEVADGLIVGVHTGPAPAGALTHDLTDRFVMPGMWDAHVHLGGSVPPYENGLRENDPRHHMARAIAKAQDNLRHGVTSVRSLGERDSADIMLRDLFAAGTLIGPRVYASGEAKWSRLEAGVDAFRKKVRQLVFSGVDQIKLVATGGIPYPGPVTAPTILRAELEAAIAEAHSWGRTVAVHAMGDDVVRMAIESGADTIEHGFACTPDIAEDFLRSNTIFCPNLVVTEFWGPDAMTGHGLPQWMADNASAARSGHHELFARAVELGVVVCAGVDNLPRRDANDYGIEHAGGIPAIVRELELMRELGLGDIETLRAVTLNAALASGVSEKSGSLEAGKLADFIVLKNNPLQDVRVLAEVDEVWLGGRRVH